MFYKNIDYEKHHHHTGEFLNYSKLYDIYSSIVRIDRFGFTGSLRKVEMATR